MKGKYRLLRKSAIDELGERTRWKKWITLAPWTLSDAKRKRLIWRDGMGEYILSRLREGAWKKLERLSLKEFYQVTLDEGLTMASLRGKVARNLMRENAVLEGSASGSEQQDLDDSIMQEHISGEAGPDFAVKGNPKGRDTEPPRLICNISSQGSTLSEDSSPSPASQLDSLPSTNQETPHISAILLLSPPSVDENWEYKLIPLENQATPTTIFNFRRLLPHTADEFFERLVGTEKAVAIASSDSSAAALRFLLRVAIYIEGDNPVNQKSEIQDTRREKTVD
jgi:hypothetical protein